MSNPRVLLARCAPRGGSYSIGTGGPEFTPADIAHAAGCIREPAGRALVLYLWADQKETWPEVRVWMMEVASKLFYKNGWQVKRPNTMGGLVRLAVYELGNPRHCPACNSTGDRAGKPCEPCEGKGSLENTDRTRALIAGMSLFNFQRWAERYEELLAEIQDIERQAINDLKHALT